MQTRTTLLATAAAAVVLTAAGIGLADTGADDVASPSPSASPSVSASPSPSPSPTATATPDASTLNGAPDGRRTVSAGAAGSVTYRFDGALTITAVDAAPGWSAETEQAQGAEIEVVFTRGARRIDVEVEIEDGAPKERVRERSDDRSGRDHAEDD